MHLITDSSILGACIYCGTKHQDHDNDFKSEFIDSFHYKTIDCGNCGRSLSVRVNFDGSGHDSFSKKSRLSDLESKIR